MTKVCSKCGEEKPATTEYFRKDKSCKDGLRGRCKDCIKEYNNQYYKENKERFQESNKQHYKENEEKIKERRKQWRKENKEYYKQYYRQYYKENKEYYKKYCKENLDRYRQREQKRAALKKRLPHTLTLDQWEKIKDDFNNECAYCGQSEQEHKEEFNQQLHQEHFIPLSKGGGYTQNNIIPACRSCNASKNDTDFFEWYPTYEYYNEEREQFILEYLGYIDDNQQLTFDIEVM